MSGFMCTAVDHSFLELYSISILRTITMASLADDYVDQMKHHPYGYALYHPVSTRDMRPGSVGFFDSLGVWNPIAHLEDSESLTRSGLRFPTRSLTVARTERIKEWTPKVSANVTETAGGVNLGARWAPPFPLQILSLDHRLQGVLCFRWQKY